jgi:glycosyltransferase involved in cell wall biosynthesis
MNGDSGPRLQNLNTMDLRREMPRNAEYEPTRVAFLMEQALGHVTHARNLHTAAQARTSITPTWVPIPFDVHGPERLMPLLRNNWSVRASWRARRALDTLLPRQPHDALVFHTQVTALFSVGHMRRVPSIVSLDATPINYDSVGAAYNHQPAGDGWLDRQKFRMNQAVFRAAAGLVAWSNWARQSVLDDYGVDGQGVSVLAPGAASEYFYFGARRKTTDRLNSAAQRARPVRLLFVGGDFKRKGGPLLLEAIRGTLGELCELHIVTNEALAPRHNVFIYNGLAPNSPELLSLFEQADAFILPSNGECLAVVLMEATAAGLPLITTGVGALAEAVRPGETGFVIAPGDQAGLNAALDALVRDPALRERMGRGGLALARAKFDASKNNQALLDLTQEVAEANRHARRAA